jgi:uncharacterized membrane protein YsdA (DUF1294 family)
MALSTLTFTVYALDKFKAKRNAWRIKERSLHLLSLFGGWPGAAIAQQLIRHKSAKKKFRIIFWLTVVVNVSILLWLCSASGAKYLAFLS